MKNKKKILHGSLCMYIILINSKTIVIIIIIIYCHYYSCHYYCLGRCHCGGAKWRVEMEVVGGLRLWWIVLAAGERCIKSHTVVEGFEVAGVGVQRIQRKAAEVGQQSQDVWEESTHGDQNNIPHTSSETLPSITIT
jgi:hypothetical protein